MLLLLREPRKVIPGKAYPRCRVQPIPCSAKSSQLTTLRVSFPFTGAAPDTQRNEREHEHGLGLVHAEQATTAALNVLKIVP